jgi:hypothetical protein
MLSWTPICTVPLDFCITFVFFAFELKITACQFGGRKADFFDGIPELSINVDFVI